MKCKKYKSVFICKFPTFELNPKIAGFDLDGTLIETKSGVRFAKTATDWMFKFPCIKNKLRKLYQAKYSIVIFTNQAGISCNRTNPNVLFKKIQLIQEELNIPIEVFIATEKDTFRKPCIGMWNILHKMHRSKSTDYTESFYIGDAAGRSKGWKPGAKRDFSVSDRKFAHNIGIKFYTPEEYFLDEPIAKFEWRSFNPDILMLTKESTKASANDLITAKLSLEPELILMVGPPASGKSFICQKYLIPNNYIHINRDTLKTKTKCLKVTNSVLCKAESCVIDNTNPTVAARKEYIDIAEKYGIKVKCFVMKTPRELAEHLNAFREKQGNNKRKKIPLVAYHKFFKTYEMPSLTEGIHEIHELDFVPDFISPEEHKLFNEFT